MTREEALAHLGQVTAGYRNTFKPSIITTYQYWAQIKSIVDADTVDMTVSLGFSLSLDERFRLIGVNAPETHSVSHSGAEYRRGSRSTEFVKARIPVGTWVEVEIFEGHREKYGRWLCQIFVDGSSLNAELLSEGLARPI